MTTTDHFSSDGDGDTVVVGIKMDSLSKELLTWALVKVAQPGDLVIALHVLAPNEKSNEDGKSSLLALVKAFDSVLGVYEGFCNLKQVDLKLKICRGSSVRKVIIREAISCSASKVVVGTSAKNHTLRSSISVAKYCAKKLPKDCSVLAVRNGKIVFHREAIAGNVKKRKDANDQHLYDVLEGLQRSSTINSVLNNDDDDDDDGILLEAGCNQGANAGSRQLVLKGDAVQTEATTNQICSICSQRIFSNNSVSCSNIEEDPVDDDKEDNSKALVPFQNLEGASSLLSLLLKELPERRPGRSLFRRASLSPRQGSPSSDRCDVSIVQRETLLPSRPYSSSMCLSSTIENSEGHEDECPDQAVQDNAVIRIRTEISSHEKSLNEDCRSEPPGLVSFCEKYASTCRLFKHWELQSATSNFMPENLIGKGGNSRVFRGFLPDGKALAIKILKPSENVQQEFMKEIEIVTSLHHNNIISLFGFCFEDSNRSLVYDLFPRGSLEENLHGSKKDLTKFGWNERFKVALGVAEALYYLHNHNNLPVIHRDVKSSNILLSKDFEPQVSDFGLAKQASSSNINITCTDVAGTFGYLAPEYFMYGKVTDKIDVYAFGVVLLELLSGRKPISSELPKGEESLVIWAKPIINGGKVSKLLDPCLGSNYDEDQIERMVLAATLCIRRAPRGRPHMSLILNLLQGDPDTLKWARFQVNASDDVDRLDEDGLPKINLQSHLSLALLDVEDDSLSVASIEQHMSLEEYFRGRWSRSSSFDRGSLVITFWVNLTILKTPIIHVCKFHCCYWITLLLSPSSWPNMIQSTSGVFMYRLQE